MKIAFNNVSHTYNNKTITAQQGIVSVSVEILPGRVYSIIGPTGSGKSTFVQHLNGLIVPTEGTIVVTDENNIAAYNVKGKLIKHPKTAKKDLYEYRPNIYEITSSKRKNKNLRDLRRKIGIVFQFPEQQLFETTVLKDVSFGPRNFKMKDNEVKNVAIEALTAVGLDESYFDRSPLDLSGGEQRKVAIAGILALSPTVLVLDEPTAGLDPKNSADLLQLIKKLSDGTRTIVIVTHDMRIALEYSDEILVFRNGRLERSESKSDLFNNLSSIDYLELPQQIKLASKLKEIGYEIDVEKSLESEYLIDSIMKGVR